MARILACDWDRGEVRLLLATARTGALRLEAAAALPLPADADAAEPTPEAIAAVLRQAADGLRPGRRLTLVGLDRASVELFPLRLPPARDAELPALVANEALREASAAGEGAAVDFAPLGGASAAARHVLAAVLPAERQARLRTVLSAAGLKADRLALRSLAAAALLARQPDAADHTWLLVHGLDEEADLIVHSGGQPALVRTARLPRDASPETRDDRLLAEIRRTLAAVQSGAEPLAPDRLCIFGAGPQCAAQCDRLSAALALPAQAIDPLADLPAAAELPPEQRGRFAALVGMASVEAAGARQAIDFLHPRQPPKRLGRRQIAALAAVAVAVVALLVGGYVWRELAAADAANAELNDELQWLTKAAARDAKHKQIVEAVREWQAGDVNWLEELREISTRFPPPSDAVVLRMSLSSAPGGGGNIIFQGLVRDPSLIVRMEYGLRSKHHAVHSRRIQEGARREDPLHGVFDTSIYVVKRTRDEYRPPAEKP